MNQFQAFTCKECGEVLNPAFKFCPKCGKGNLIYRSENEVTAELKKLKELKMTNPVTLANYMSLLVCLEWVLGGQHSPSDLLRQAEETISKARGGQ
jgi:predicted nucleic-acid-binding Zn-ribbon protein